MRDLRNINGADNALQKAEARLQQIADSLQNRLPEKQAHHRQKIQERSSLKERIKLFDT